MAQHRPLTPDPAERGPQAQSAVGEDDPSRDGAGDEESEKQEGHLAIFRFGADRSIRGTAR